MQSSSDLPFVTCLCLTKGRKEWLRGVVDAFMKQDYKGRSELLLVADVAEDIGDSSSPDSLWNSFPYEFYPHHFVGGISVGPFPVGKKRNLGIKWAAPGTEIISIWDDDDYSAPGRLTQQVEILLATGKAVTGYTSLKFTDGRDWWRFNYNRIAGTGCPGCDDLRTSYCGNFSNPARYEYVHATSLCFRRDWWEKHPFEELQVGQDERFALAASAADQLAPCPDLDLMYATIHPGNTSPRVRINGALVGSNWEPLPGYVSPHPSVFPPGSLP